MAPTPKRSRPSPQSRPAPKKPKELNVDLKFPRSFNIFPLALRTSIKENWEADLLVELFDPVSEVQSHRYSIRCLDINGEVETVHGRAFASLHKANFELMRLVLGGEMGSWKAAEGEPREANPEFVKGQSVAMKASRAGRRVRGWGFDVHGCLAFWEREVRGERAELKGLFVQRMGAWLEAGVQVQVQVKVEGD